MSNIFQFVTVQVAKTSYAWNFINNQNPMVSRECNVKNVKTIQLIEGWTWRKFTVDDFWVEIFTQIHLTGNKFP